MIGGLTVKQILKQGNSKVKETTPLSADDNAEDDDAEDDDAEDEGWTELEYLAARIFIFAEDYGIADLAGEAIEEIDQAITWNKDCSLPWLEILLAPDNVHLARSNSEMWDIVAQSASNDFQRLSGEERFQKLMVANPALQWDVMKRVATKLAEAQEEVKELNASVQALQPKKKKQKKNPTPDS